jgi:prepilin-type processing-associated H-X9-DG protein
MTMMIGLGYEMAPYPLRHGKSYNQLCCDGHVEALPPSKLFNCSQTAPQWNNDDQPHPETWH